MTKTRLEAFSDAVIAIIITIMVLELKVPHDTSFDTLMKLWPVFLSYALSFLILGIYWGNHHHLVHTIKEVRGGILWANLHLLFWLSLIPFVTGWMGENSFSTIPVVLYGVVLLMAGIAYYILAHNLAGLHGKDSTLAEAIGKDRKGILSVLILAVGIGLSLVNPVLGLIIYALIAVIWFIPDSRIEKRIAAEKKSEKNY